MVLCQGCFRKDGALCGAVENPFKKKEVYNLGYETSLFKIR